MPPEPLESIFKYLRHLATSQFYGTASLRFDKGRVVLLNLQQALKPETILELNSTGEPKPRRNYDSVYNE